MLYRLGSLFLDVSLGLLLLAAAVRLILAFTWFRRNGCRTLTECQRKSLRKVIIPIAIAALLLGVASLILLLIC